MIQWLNYVAYGAVGLLLIATLWFRGEAESAAKERDALQTKYDTVKAVNDDQKLTITRITAMRAQDDAILKVLSADVAAINKATADQTAAIQDLERSNVTVRDFLAMPIPDDLRRLLNGSP